MGSPTASAPRAIAGESGAGPIAVSSNMTICHTQSNHNCFQPTSTCNDNLCLCAKCLHAPCGISTQCHFRRWLSNFVNKRWGQPYNRQFHTYQYAIQTTRLLYHIMWDTIYNWKHAIFQNSCCVVYSLFLPQVHATIKSACVNTFVVLVIVHVFSHHTCRRRRVCTKTTLLSTMAVCVYIYAVPIYYQYVHCIQTQQ